MFDDEFYLFRKEENGTETPITINSNSIAWLSDVTSKFQNTDMSLVPESYKQFIQEATGKEVTSWEQIQWKNMTDEHFVIWMRTAGL